MGESIAQRLDHVYWIGGSPCSGKSSIVEILSETYAFQSYNCDDAFWRHGEQVTAEAQPTFHKVLRMTWDEIWMRPVEELLTDEVDIYHEEFALILEDLLSLPRSSPIIVEGAALLPGLVRSVLLDPQHAIWIVPTEAFQREHYPKRGERVQGVLNHCEHRDRAFRNWMDRDVAFARWVSHEALALGLSVLHVDGKRTFRENARAVEGHFQPREWVRASG